MRIKKVEESKLVEGHVINSLEVGSSTNAPSIDAVNGLKPILGWQNPNPNEGMNAQEITLSTNDYDMVEVIYVTDTAATEWKYIKSTGKLPYQTKYNISLGTYVAKNTYESSPQSFSRYIAPSSDKTKMTIKEGYLYKDSYSERATSAVPLYIILYKTGLFN